jgi:hypothetical protein
MGGYGSGTSGGRPTAEDSETNEARRAKTKDKANARALGPEHADLSVGRRLVKEPPARIISAYKKDMPKKS